MWRNQALPRALPTRLLMLLGFSLFVAVFVAALAVGLARLLRDSIRDAALSGAEQTGQLFAELEVGEEEYSGKGLAPDTPGDLDIVVESSVSLRVARLWDQEGQLLYASDRAATSRAKSNPAAVRRALEGKIDSEVLDAAHADRVLKIYVPIVLAGDARPRGVLEVHLPYAPVQSAIDRRTRNLAAVLILAALLFYLALLPSVLRGSRALSDLYEARQLPLQHRLRRAMRDGELALHYHPKLDLRTGAIDGVEALLRWRLGDGSMVPPAEYIPLIESTPVIGALSEHVFNLAVAQSAAWAGQGIQLTIAVNISVCNLREPDLPDRFARLASAGGRSPSDFMLELTESAVGKHVELELRTVKALRARGFRLSVDDFGTGESSLSRVDSIEFQEVKIDQSFMRKLAGDPAVVAGIITLAHALGARAVAEGVETEAVTRQLVALGCDGLQGFHLARPMPGGELPAWLRDFSNAPRWAALG